jgi:hypothetical protein
VDAEHSRAEEAGEQMHSELDAIQERLRALKRRLDAREAVIAVDEGGEAAELVPQPAQHSGA